MAIEVEENRIKPPKSPLTAKINLSILHFYFERFAKRYLPAFRYRITSDYRDTAKNKEVGGAANSAHLHGLALDFVLLDQNGKPVPKAQAKAVFDEFIAPNWPGFALWESDHIHVNLSRKISEFTAAAGIAVLGALGIHLINKLTGEK